MRLIRYASSNIYRLWDPMDRRISMVRDVIFDETQLRIAKLVMNKSVAQAESSIESTNETLSNIMREALNQLNLDAINDEALIACFVRIIMLNSS
jgi:hypothetical protein